MQGLDGGCSRLTTHAHAGVRTHRHCRHHSVVCCHVCPCARGDSGARSRRCTRVVQPAHRSHTRRCPSTSTLPSQLRRLSSCVSVRARRQRCKVSMVLTSGAGGSPLARTRADVHIDNDHCRHHSIVVVCCHVCRCVCGSRRASMCLWRGGAAASRRRSREVQQVAHPSHARCCCGISTVCSSWLTARTHAGACTHRHCRHHSVVCLHVCCGSRRVSMCLWRAAASRQ